MFNNDGCIFPAFIHQGTLGSMESPESASRREIQAQQAEGVISFRGRWGTRFYETLMLVPKDFLSPVICPHRAPDLSLGINGLSAF